MALAIIFFLAVMMAGGAVWLFARAGRREHEEGMLLRLRAVGGEQPGAAGPSGRGQIDNAVLRWFCHLVWRTGADLSSESIVRILLVLVVLAIVAVLILGLIGGLSATAVLFALAWAWLTRQGALRRAKIIEQLPAFLEGVIRVLGAGNTLDEAITASAKESPDPIKPLFLSVGRQIRLGAPVEAVLMEMGEIHRLRDLKVMSLAAAINRKYGGSLRGLLRSLIQAVRARESAARELRALTAETRFSAMVLSLIPVALVLFITLQNPDYYRNMWADGAGKGLLVFSVGLQVVGMGIIYRMMRSTGDGT